ncbi:unnamed protein product [Acanthoscelides obtectus]|uniref:Uncharacterized protein n=1 Tax=Acanthoscelides obtectus TaxID=200917 RepID=A0A9P0PDL8_ACAOB|nr:unnamed protein product [Acanthoscelides obtectus]CAK1655967.1 hypothetical protein AOBTE_LOCUS19477 [Acanthoscelides obtectus]
MRTNTPFRQFLYKTFTCTTKNFYFI